MFNFVHRNVSARRALQFVICQGITGQIFATCCASTKTLRVSKIGVANCKSVLVSSTFLFC